MLNGSGKGKTGSFWIGLVFLSMAAIGGCSSASGNHIGGKKTGTPNDIHPIVKRHGLIPKEIIQSKIPNPSRLNMPTRRSVLLSHYRYLSRTVSLRLRNAPLIDAVKIILPPGTDVSFGDIDYRTPVSASIDKVPLYDALRMILRPVGANFVPHKKFVKVTRTENAVFRLPMPDVTNMMNGMVGNMLTSGGAGMMGGGYGGAGGGSGGSSGLISVNMISGMVTFWQSLQQTLNGMASGSCSPPTLAPASMMGGSAGGQGGYGGGAGGYGGTSGALPYYGASAGGFAYQGASNPGVIPGGGGVPGNNRFMGPGQNQTGVPPLGSNTPCGHIRVDTESGYIYVWDTVSRVFKIGEYLDEIKRLLQKQVYLKIDIVEVELNDQNQYGINFTALLKQLAGTGATFAGGAATNAGLGTSPVPYSLGVSNGNGTSSAIIQALSTYGKTHIVNQPRVLAISGQPSTINVTQNIPYLQSEMPYSFGGLNSSSLVIPQIGYATTGLSVEMNPVIDNKTVHLHIVPVLNTLTQFVSIDVKGLGTFQEPEIDSRATSNDITVHSDQTIFFGGLVADTINNQYWSVPLLGSIPGLRWLFSGYNLVRTVDELVLIVTPIVTDTGNAVETSVPSTHDLMHIHQDQSPMRLHPQKGINVGPSTF